MKQNEFFHLLGHFRNMGRDPDVVEYLKGHFSPSEMDSLKSDPIYFYMGASEADQDRIWNAVECRMHKRQMPMAAE